MCDEKKHFYILVCYGEVSLIAKSFNGVYIFLTAHNCQKSLEEEKKEHVEKAKELQKWVSNISKTLKDAEKAGKPPFSMQKVFTEVRV